MGKPSRIIPSSIRFADEAQSMADVAAGEVEILIVDSAAHSTELVTTAEPPVVVESREATCAFSPSMPDDRSRCSPGIRAAGG
jgi:hypothetical protein